MKQRYEKPGFVIERFSLTQTIAESCGFRHDEETGWGGSPAYYSKESCGWNDGYGQIVWVNTPSPCEFPAPEDLTIGYVCYNNPEGGLTAFAS